VNSSAERIPAIRVGALHGPPSVPNCINRWRVAACDIDAYTLFCLKSVLARIHGSTEIDLGEAFKINRVQPR